MNNGFTRADNHRTAHLHPRVILAGVLALTLLAIAVYALAPWILPVRIYEGPLVQLASEDGAVLVWYTTRPAACTFEVTIDGQAATVPVQANGRRHLVRLSGLSAGTRYPYEIRLGRRPLTHGLELRTNRPAGERFSFIVFGDSGMGTRAQYELARRMTMVTPMLDLPDFVLHTGDLVYMDGARRRYEARFFAPYRYLLARVCFWPALGNHDIEDDGTAPAYEEVFELPDNGPPGAPADHHYWFDYGDCRVAVIDSNVEEATLRDLVAPWLEDVLTARPALWRFVVFHHPPYTGGKYRPATHIQSTLVPVMEAAGVDVVFNGHDHSYQRTYPLRGGQIVPPGEGIVYVISAAGGGRLYDPAPTPPAYIAAANHDQFSFTLVTVHGDELTLRQVGLEGELIDQCSWQKRATNEPDNAASPDPTAAQPVSSYRSE